VIELRAVLFDFDGLLVDSEPVHYRGFAEIVRRFGLRLTESDYYARYVGLDDRDVFRAIFRDAGRPEPVGRDLEALIAEKTALVQADFAAGLEPKPGAAEFVRRAAEHFVIGLCSGALRREVEGGLDRLGVRSLFTAVITAEDVMRSKPDPEGYVRLLGVLGEHLSAAGQAAIEAHQSVSLEDTTAGLRSARGAGAWAIGVVGTEPREDLLAVGHAVLDSLVGVDPRELAGMLSTGLARE
jgi:HAD superfamily hydrolase (TIGR01509 family)